MKKLIKIKDNSPIEIGNIFEIHPNKFDVLRGFSDSDNFIFSNEVFLPIDVEDRKIHLYCMDTEAEIKENDWYIFKDSLFQSQSSNTKIKSYKIIATTNPNLNLPLIQNVEECERLMSREIRIEFEYPFFLTNKEINIHKLGILKQGTKLPTKAILPTGDVEYAYLDDTLTKWAQVLKQDITYHHFCNIIDDSEEETIEEAANTFLYKAIALNYDLLDAFKAGANWKKEQHNKKQVERLKELSKDFIFVEPKPMYTEEEVKNLLSEYSTFLQVKGFSTCLEREWFETNKKN